MNSQKPSYYELINHYEQCLEQYGSTPKGVDWPNLQDLMTRFKVMLNVCKTINEFKTVELLDLGCGYGALLEFIQSMDFQSHYKTDIHYKGMDLSSKMIAAAIKKSNHPDLFEQRDILETPLDKESFDYIIMNGVFTEKRNLSQVEMTTFFSNMLSAAFNGCRYGMAFNVMNHHVDWRRNDLFHLSFDSMVEILIKHCSRHFIIRADYGLYEYTVYVYKE